MTKMVEPKNCHTIFVIIIVWCASRMRERLPFPLSSTVSILWPSSTIFWCVLTPVLLTAMRGKHKCTKFGKYFKFKILRDYKYLLVHCAIFSPSPSLFLPTPSCQSRICNMIWSIEAKNGKYEIEIQAKNMMYNKRNTLENIQRTIHNFVTE